MNERVAAERRTASRRGGPETAQTVGAGAVLGRPSSVSVAAADAGRLRAMGADARAAAVAGLQTAVGNRGVQRILACRADGNACCAQCRRTKAEAAGLPVSAPGDRQEREADRVAKRVLRAPASDAAGASTAGGGAGDGRAPAAWVPGGAPAMVGEVVRSPGQPLDAATRGFMEPRFGRDLSNVRVHTDARAEVSAAAIDARAYTVGSHIAFAAGEYAPGSDPGRRLLAHELAHVVQQDAGGRSLWDRFVQRQGNDEAAAPGTDRLVVWLNAFIPGELPGLTQTVPGGPHEGKTMIPVPWFVPADCFLTDNRGFSSQSDVTQRMRQGFVIDLASLRVLADFGYSDPTKEIGCETGEVECRSMGSSRGISYEVEERTATSLRLSIVGEGNNPCVWGSPDIDYEGDLCIDTAGANVVITFDGYVDDFPAFEMYVVDTATSRVYTVFRSMPPEGNTPMDLWGSASNPRQGSARIGP